MVTSTFFPFRSRVNGAPVDYVRSGKMMGDGHYALPSNESPHPNAGKAFIDYLLSEESMKILAKMGEFVYHCHIVQHADQGMIANIEVISPLANLYGGRAKRLDEHAFHRRSHWARRTPGAEFILKHRIKALPVIAEQKSSATKLSLALGDSGGANLR